MSDERRRRRFLQGGAAALVVASAGCASVLDEETGSGESDLRRISFGQTRQGSVDSGDGRDPAYDDLAEPVQFSGEIGGRVVVSMASDAFDPYVVLAGPNGVIAENDDGPDGENSRVVTTLPATDTYTIWAGSVAGDATGPYTLTLR